ncbi:MAG: ATP-binding protein, partial [Candidatus Aminicenantia bacterium]
IFNPEKGELSFPIFFDRGKPLKLKPIRIEEASGLTGWIVKNKKPIMFLDYEKEKEALPLKPLIIIKASQSNIGVPIIYKEKVLGVISIQSYKKNAFTQRHFYLLKIIANQIALAIENARLFNEAKTALLKLKDNQKKLIKTEKMRFLGTLSAGIAHQFNNILSAILARAQILSSKTEDPEIRKGLEIIEKASLGGADIVRRILEFSKLEQKEKGEPVNLYQIVEDAIHITEVKWKNEAERKGIKIEIINEVDKSIFVKGNSSELREALLNVISNSIEALEHEGFIHIRSELMKTKVLLEIKDNGIGISQSDIERVFEPFFTTKGITGTGLGLSFVYGVVKKYKGDIKIESERGKGTTVKIYLINAKYPKLEIKGETRIKEEKLPLKILVIEDEEYVLDLIVEILKNDGHYVSYARSGDDGLKKFERERFDLVITDLGMPGISGWEVVERIRIKNSEVRIGIITGWNIRGEVERLRELGVEFVITKPFRVEHIKLAINKERNGEIFVNLF